MISADGQISMAGGPLGAADGPRLSAAQLSDTGTPFSATAVGGSGNSWRVLVQPLSGGRHLVIASSLGDLNSTVTRLEIADAVAGAVCVVLLAGIGLPLVRASLAPLARIQATATAIASGDLSRRIDQPAGNTEVGRLAEALDVMLASIETAYLARADGEARALGSEERMRRFVADASHELRTPLTSVRGLAEHGLQQDAAATREELLRLMALIAGEADRMGRLVADLLLLARYDAGRPLDRRPVDLASLAAEAVIRARIVDPGRPITLVAAEPVIVDADDERLRQVIDNLIGNALQHTPPGSPVTVTVTGTLGRGSLPSPTRALHDGRNSAQRACSSGSTAPTVAPAPGHGAVPTRPGHRGIAGRRSRRGDHRRYRARPRRGLPCAPAAGALIRFGVSLRTVCCRLGHHLALHNHAAIVRAPSTAFRTRPDIPESSYLNDRSQTYVFQQTQHGYRNGSRGCRGRRGGRLQQQFRGHHRRQQRPGLSLGHAIRQQ